MLKRALIDFKLVLFSSKLKIKNMNSNINKLVLMDSEELKAELHNVLIEQKKIYLKSCQNLKKKNFLLGRNYQSI